MGQRLRLLLRDLARDVAPTVRSTLVAIVALAITAATFLAVQATSGSVTDDLLSARARRAEDGAVAMRRARDGLVGTIEVGLRSLAPWDREAAPPADARLDLLLDADAGVVAVEVVADGMVAMSSGGPQQRGFARSGDHLDRVLATGETVVTGVRRDPELGLDVLLVAVAIPAADGTPAAIGVARVPTSGTALNKTVSALEEASSPSPRVGAVLPDGSVLTALGLESTNDELWRAAIAGVGPTPGAREHERPDGSRWITATSPVDDWQLVMTQVASDVVPPLLDRRSALAAVPGLVALLALLAVSGVAHRRRVRLLARDAEDTKRSFLAVTGHELRTPLTVMGGMLRTLKSALDRGVGKPEAIADMIDASRRNAQLLELRIERILLVAALDAGEGATVQLRDVQVEPLLADLVETVSQTAPAHTFEVDVEEELSARADPKALGQVVLELLTNAVRYTPGGGTIRVVARSRGRRVVVTVEDEGVGLPSDERRLFDKFQQGEDVDRRVHDEGGVGLGLWIAKTLVTAMDGTIRAEPGDQGARFVVEMRNN